MHDYSSAFTSSTKELISNDALSRNSRPVEIDMSYDLDGMGSLSSYAMTSGRSLCDIDAAGYSSKDALYGLLSNMMLNFAFCPPACISMIMTIFYFAVCSYFMTFAMSAWSSTRTSRPVNTMFEP